MLMILTLILAGISNNVASLILIQPIVGFGEAQQGRSALFRCQSSSELRGQVFTPSIPDFYFNHENAAAFSNGGNANLTTLLESSTYIFTIHPQDCCGTFTALQYCYKISSTSTQRTFINFNFVTRIRLRLTFVFSEQISILSGFTFALISQGVQLLSFADSATAFQAERIETRTAIIQMGGGSVSFSVGEEDIFTNRSIPLFRFLMGT